MDRDTLRRKIKKVNFTIRRLYWLGKTQPVGFPHATGGKAIFFDVIQDLLTLNKQYRKEWKQC